MAFSRGLHTGWLGGINNQKLVHARFPKKRGVYLGEVKEIGRGAVRIKPLSEISRGDGIVFDAGEPESKEQGGRVYEVRRVGGDVELEFGNDAVDFSKLHVGDKIWKTDDPALNRELRKSFTEENIRHKQLIRIAVSGSENEPLTIVLRDRDGHISKASSEVKLQKAEKSQLTEEILREKLGRLGDTPFKLGTIEVGIPPGLMLPLSELNKVRREAVHKLLEERSQTGKWIVNEGKPSIKAASNVSESSEPTLTVTVRTTSQLEAVLEEKIATIYCDFEDVKRYRGVVEQVRKRSEEDGFLRSVFVAAPRVHKEGEEWVLKQTLNSHADGYLVRNFDHFRYFAGNRLRGDFSLNVANSLSAEYLMGRFKPEQLTASYDLNIVELESLMGASPASWYEVTIHQHMPMFHMEHCVFCAFLSDGTDYTNCGRPCDTHDVRLRDQFGNEHQLKADFGCRNTVYNGHAQSGADFVERLKAAGVRKFRVELLNESFEKSREIVALYKELIRGQISSRDLWQKLKVANQLGVTRGQMAG